MAEEEFKFYAPTKIYFRENGLKTIGEIIKKDYGFDKVFLVYGTHLKGTENFDILIKSLKENNIEYTEYTGISANPDLEDVVKMIAQARVFQPNLILAFGGGSVIDASKSLASGYFYEGNPIDFNRKVVSPLHALPVATILTLAASGSEMSDSCVISDRKHNFKNGFNSDNNRPLFSLLDPTLTYTVSKYQTAMGLIDMFCHSFERYCSPSHKIEPCDGLALSVLSDIVKITDDVLSNPDDYEARRNMMILGTLAHNGFTSFGKKFYFRIHQAEHRLSGAYPLLTHGQGIALLMIDFLNLNKDILSDKIIRLGEQVFKLINPTVDDVIQSLKNWLDKMPIYHSFSELPYEIDNELLSKAYELLKIK